MADRLEWFAITVPAGTAIATPVTIHTKFNQGNVIEVDIKVPPGPSGNVGFAIFAGGSQYIPRTNNTFVIPDNDYMIWPVANAINSGSWSVKAYNTDLYDHLLQVAFHVNELQFLPSMHVGMAIGL